MQSGSRHKQEEPADDNRQVDHKSSNGDPEAASEHEDKLAEPDVIVKEANHLISFSVCVKISWLTQLVLTAAVVGYMYIVVNSLVRESIDLGSAFIESKEDVYLNKTWLRFALCLRPVVSASVLKYAWFLNAVQSKKRDLLDMSEHVKNISLSTFGSNAWLDPQISKDAFTEYFEKVHPWGHFPLSSFFDISSQRAEKSLKTITLNKIISGHRSLEGKQRKLVHKDFKLSPFYSGCFNFTVLEPMDKRPMEIELSFKGPQMQNLHQEFQREFPKGPPFQLPESLPRVLWVNPVEWMDLYVYGRDEAFTEFQDVTHLARYSIDAKHHPTIYVSATRRTNAVENCTADHLACMHWCKVRRILRHATCQMPWMTALHRRYPAATTTRPGSRECASQRDARTAIKFQHGFTQSRPNKEATSTATCECDPPCNQWKMTMDSVGSVASREPGITMVVSPRLTNVKEHARHRGLPMMGEVAGAISFLFGLTAIMLFDWVMAVLKWVHQAVTRAEDAWRWHYWEDDAFHELMYSAYGELDSATASSSSELESSTAESGGDEPPDAERPPRQRAEDRGS